MKRGRDDEYRIMAGTDEIMVHTAGRALIKEAQ